MLLPSDEEYADDSLLHHALIAANITDRFDLTCGLVNYLRYFMRFVSAYVIVAFTVQRTLAIHSPFFQRKFASKTLAWSCAGVLTALGLVFSSWVPFLFSVTPSNDNNEDSYCDVQRAYSSHYFVITIVYITVIMLIPIVIIFVCNTLIIYYVFEASKIRLGMMNKSSINNTPRSNSEIINAAKVGIYSIFLAQSRCLKCLIWMIR